MARNRQIRLGMLLLVMAGVLAAAGCPGDGDNLAERTVRRFSGEPKLSFYSHKTRNKTAMALEDYITGVVAGEMKPRWDRDAYAAQAIVARTFTLEFLSRGGTRDIHGSDICDDPVHAQAYNAANITDTIKEAVRSTRGQAMVYKNRHVKGWFSASCGGKTTTAKVGLAYAGPEPAYIEPVSCPERRITPPEVKAWNARIPSERVLAALKKIGKPLPGLEGAKILRNVGGRAAEIQLTGGGQSVEVPGASFRVAVGPELMRSIYLSRLEVEGGDLVASGTGFGHGVGLCQWGALALARDGRKPVDIVKHYYPKVEIRKFWQ